MFTILMSWSEGENSIVQQPRIGIFSGNGIEISLIKKFKKKLLFKNFSGLVDTLSVKVLESTDGAVGYDETTLSDDEFIGNVIE